MLVWLTGLPGSGKTTLARAFAQHLRAAGEVAFVLDGDELRAHLHDGYDDAGRERFHATLRWLARLAVDGGALVIVSATAHHRAWRDAARAEVASFVEVWLSADRGVCAARDPKGLWRAAAEGRITGLPGADAIYEAPLAPDLVIAPDVPVTEAVRHLDSVVRARRGQDVG